MARKPKAKPLFSLKQDFIDSLETFCNEAVFLHQQVQTALELNCISNPAIAAKIKERLDAFKAAMMEGGDE